MLKLIKKLFPYTFKKSIKDHLGVPSLSWSLQNIKKAGYKPGVVYDIGAYEGYWALDFLKVFPNSPIYMFEAQQTKEAFLKKIVDSKPNLHYSIALLGAQDGVAVHFEENETASHVDISAKEISGTNRITQQLDLLIEKNKYPLPDFLKLDVQGYELEILKGATKALTNAEFCLLEISLIDLGGGCPLLLDVVNFMDAKEFCAYDISQFIRRPFDKALWQIDMLFIKKNSSFIAEKRWD